ncbi:hypothetical protein AB0467_08580 [Streptomyces sp. NPDC052095]|uniref:hypothetical protein n=1 Tax=unclassified Streptomyces TaxID=2593676 RepID=UPI003450F5D5
MSQFLVVLYNDTDGEINFRNTEFPADNRKVPPGGMFRTKNHFNVPDCSDKEYFDSHHMEIVDTSGTVIFSFWGDDSKDYDLYHCPALQYGEKEKLPGGAATGGNKRDVAVVISGGPGNYQLKGRKVQNDV